MTSNGIHSTESSMAWRWSELMGRETTSNSGGLGGAAQLLADQCRRTWHGTRARDVVLGGPPVHANLASAAALPHADQHGAAVGIKLGLGDCERFADPQPRAPEHHDHARSLAPSALWPAARMTAMICSTVGGSGG
jgi:hypothetical protein